MGLRIWQVTGQGQDCLGMARRSFTREQRVRSGDTGLVRSIDKPLSVYTCCSRSRQPGSCHRLPQERSLKFRDRSSSAIVILATSRTLQAP